MNFLPEEILLEIFQYLSGSDLIALSTVSNVFNEVIGSSKLVEKLQLSFRKLNGDEETIGNRQYINLKIGFYKPTIHYGILKRIGDNLKMLSFVNCKLKIDSIRKILNETPNVNNLNFERVSLSDVPNVMKQPQPNLRIQSLTSIVSDPRLFRVIRGCAVQEINLTQNERDTFDNFSDFIQLLRFQHVQLKSLSLTGFCKTSLFSDNSLDSVCFRLEKFSLIDCLFQKTIHLKSFLEVHVESLREVEISDVDLCDLSSVLNQMKSLKRLRLSNVSMSYLETLPSVEELNVRGNKVPETVFEKMPSIKHLRLKRVRNRRMLNRISENLLEVESLKLIDGSLEELALPSIKKLTLTNIGDCPSCFFELHCNIEELFLDNCKFVNDEAIEEIASSLKNLRKIVLMNQPDLTNSSLQSIRDKCKFIKFINIHGSHLNWKIFLDQKEIKVFI